MPCLRDNVAFDVVARGTEPIYYQWLRDDVPLPNETNATLLITSVQTNHSGMYRVVATNEIGMVTSDPAELIVTAAPNITRQPLDVVAFVGSNAVFVVRHCPFPDPFSFQWFSNDVEIAGATNDTLVITAVDFDDAGFYSVQITNLNGEAVSEPAELSVSVYFTVTCAGSPLVCTIMFDTEDGYIYSIERRDATSPAEWTEVYSSPDISDGSPVTFFDDPPAESLPAGATIPVYRVLRILP
jgi:hypothetical protein